MVPMNLSTKIQSLHNTGIAAVTARKMEFSPPPGGAALQPLSYSRFNLSSRFFFTKKPTWNGYYLYIFNNRVNKKIYIYQTDAWLLLYLHDVRCALTTYFTNQNTILVQHFLFTIHRQYDRRPSPFQQYHTAITATIFFFFLLFLFIISPNNHYRMKLIYSIFTKC